MIKQKQSLIRNSRPETSHSRTSKTNHLLEWLDSVNLQWYFAFIVLFFVVITISSQIGLWGSARRGSKVCQSRKWIAQSAYDYARMFGYKTECWPHEENKESNLNTQNQDEQFKEANDNIQEFEDPEIFDLDLTDADKDVNLRHIVNGLPEFKTYLDNMPATGGSKSEMSNCDMWKSKFNDTEGQLILGAFDKIIGYKSLGLNMSKDAAKKIHSYFTAERNRYAEVRVLTDNDFVEGVRENAKNLDTYQQAIVDSKEITHTYREKFIALFKELELTKSASDEIDSKIKEASERKLNLGNQLDQLKQQLDSTEGSLDDHAKKEKGLTEEETSAITKIRLQKESILTQKADSMQKLKKLENDYSAEYSHIQSLKTQYNFKKEELERIQKEHASNNTTLNSSKSKLQSLDLQKNFLSIRLNVLISTKEIKNLLESVLNKDTNIDDLKALMDNKINNEERLLKLNDLFNKESQKISEKGDGDDKSSELKNYIEKDKEDYLKIVESYKEFKKVVEEYGDEDFEINNLKIRIKEIEKTEESTRELIRAAEARLKNTQALIDSLKPEFDKLEIESDQKDKAFETKASSLEFLKSEMERLNRDLKSNNDDYLATKDKHAVRS